MSSYITGKNLPSFLDFIGGGTADPDTHTAHLPGNRFTGASVFVCRSADWQSPDARWYPVSAQETDTRNTIADTLRGCLHHINLLKKETADRLRLVRPVALAKGGCVDSVYTNDNSDGHYPGDLYLDMGYKGKHLNMPIKHGFVVLEAEKDRYGNDVIASRHDTAAAAWKARNGLQSVVQACIHYNPQNNQAGLINLEPLIHSHTLSEHERRDLLAAVTETISAAYEAQKKEQEKAVAVEKKPSPITEATRAQAEELESIAQNHTHLVEMLEKGLVNLAVSGAASTQDFLEQYPRGGRTAAKVMATNSLRESYGSPKLWEVVNGQDAAQKHALLDGKKTPHHIRFALEKQIKDGLLPAPARKGVRM